MPRTNPPKNAHKPLLAPDAIPARDSASDNGEALTSGAAPMDSRPLAQFAGKYNDEPIWNDFLQAMQETRRKMDAGNKEESRIQHKVNLVLIRDSS